MVTESRLPTMSSRRPPALPAAEARRRVRAWVCNLMACVLLLQGLVATQVQVFGRWHRHAPAPEATLPSPLATALGTLVAHWVDHALHHAHGHDHGRADRHAHGHDHAHDHAHDRVALHAHAADDLSVQAAGADAESRLGALAAALGPVQASSPALALRRDGHVWNAARLWRAHGIELEPPLKPPRTA